MSSKKNTQKVSLYGFTPNEIFNLPTTKLQDPTKVSECWASKSRKISVPKTRIHNAPKQYKTSLMKDFY
jgi:hypothetical protein